jgi:mannose-6-phosphate isomerase-like protein (cupin superfamily)
MAWDTRQVPERADALAPDGSEIRLLPSLERGSMVHCRLQPGAVTRAVQHRSVDELWLCLSGTGQLWRRDGQAEETVDLVAGVAISLPVGTAFQFRANGAAPLELVIVTMPPWPGEAEAVPVEGAWTPRLLR